MSTTSKLEPANTPVLQTEAAFDVAGGPSGKRLQRILAQVQKKGFVPIEALARNYGVTPQTIRRDINKLCKKGLLRRYHGGAGVASSVKNVDYGTRRVMCSQEKDRIARLVAGHIPDHASLFINIGTTTEAVARALLIKRGLRIITNNLHVAMTLSANPDFEVLIAGGLVRNKDRGITGEAAIDFIEQFKTDFGIIGISGIDADGTLLDFEYREVRAARAIIANSRQVFLVADHTKFGRNAIVRLAPIGDIDALFTDRRPPQTLMSRLAAADTKLVVAEDRPATGASR